MRCDMLPFTFAGIWTIEDPGYWNEQDIIECQRHSPEVDGSKSYAVLLLVPMETWGSSVPALGSLRSFGEETSAKIILASKSVRYGRHYSTYYNSNYQNLIITCFERLKRFDQSEASSAFSAQLHWACLYVELH